MRHQLLTALACSAAFFSFGANAAKSGTDGTFTGTYVIEALPNNTLDHSNPKCLMFDAAQGVSGIRLHRGNWGGPCGEGHPYVMVPIATPERAWDIAPVKHSDGRTAHVIRSRANGQCLIRSNRGFNVVPSLHMWSGTNPQWCGLSSANALIENGQAAWVFGESPTESGTLVSSMAVLRNGLGYLSFASTNTSLREDQAMIAVDHIFRFVRVAEECDNPHALQPDVLRVCGLGDFAAPLRAEDRAYLPIGTELWSPAPGKGDVGQAYVMPSVQDAALYCGALRTGGFADWRVPVMADLMGLLDAFPNNTLFTRFGWPTGDLPFQSTDRVGGDVQVVTLHNRGFERLSEWANAPVVCVR